MRVRVKKVRRYVGTYLGISIRIYLQTVRNGRRAVSTATKLRCKAALPCHRQSLWGPSAAGYVRPLSVLSHPTAWAIPFKSLVRRPDNRCQGPVPILLFSIIFLPSPRPKPNSCFLLTSFAVQLAELQTNATPPKPHPQKSHQNGQSQPHSYPHRFSPAQPSHGGCHDQPHPLSFQRESDLLTMLHCNRRPRRLSHLILRL